MERGGPRPSGGQVQFVFSVGSLASVGSYAVSEAIIQEYRHEIVVVEEALAHAHKVLQDLKVKRQRILSTLIVPVISLDASLLAGLIP